MTAPDSISVIGPELQGRTVASQRWSTLTFLHWRVESDRISPLLPAGVRPDEHDGSSWVGLIGFHLGKATLGGSPPIPYLGDFAEINVRLYGIDESGRRGVVFVSLEASRLLAVLAARAVFSIPYFWSSTALDVAGQRVEYLSHRHVGRGSTRFVATAQDELVVGDATADFLTARWGLYTSRFGRTVFLPNAHEPWTLQRAILNELDDTLLEVVGFPGLAERTPDSVLYSAGVTTRFGRPQK